MDVLTQAVQDARRNVGSALADVSGAVGLLQALQEDLRVHPEQVVTDPAGTMPPRLELVYEKLLETIKSRAPLLVDNKPLPPSAVGVPVPVVAEQVGPLLAAAAQRAFADPRGQLPSAVVWREGADALVVLLDHITATVGEGAITITVPVACDQLPDLRGTVVVPFAVGSPSRPAGLVAATETDPRGPIVVVRRWGEALTALAWRALLDLVAGVAGASGRDQDGAPLVPASVAASDKGLLVLPQARHPFDRLTPTAAVTAVPTAAERLLRPTGGLT